MGKRKAQLEYINNDKKRMKSFDLRKESLIKKLREITVLCDVKACAIIYDESSQSPTVWPENPDEVHQLIAKYKDKSQANSVKKQSMSDFYEAEKIKIALELKTLRKKMYPTWTEPLNALTEMQCRVFHADLKKKVELVKSRIQELKNSKSDGGVAADPKVYQCDWSLMKQQSTGVANLNVNQSHWSLMNQQQPCGYNFGHPCLAPSFVDQQPCSVDKMNGISDQASYESTLGQGVVRPTIYDAPGAYYNKQPVLQQQPLSCYTQLPLQQPQPLLWYTQPQQLGYYGQPPQLLQPRPEPCYAQPPMLLQSQPLACYAQPGVAMPSSMQNAGQVT